MHRYGPAIRELFSFVILDNQHHAEGVLQTLRQSAESKGGLLDTVVRKLSLILDPAPADVVATPARTAVHAVTATGTVAPAFGAVGQGGPHAQLQHLMAQAHTLGAGTNWDEWIAAVHAAQAAALAQMQQAQTAQAQAQPAQTQQAESVQIAQAQPALPAQAAQAAPANAGWTIASPIVPAPVTAVVSEWDNESDDDYGWNVQWPISGPVSPALASPSAPALQHLFDYPIPPDHLTAAPASPFQAHVAPFSWEDDEVIIEDPPSPVELLQPAWLQPDQPHISPAAAHSATDGVATAQEGQDLPDFHTPASPSIAVAPAPSASMATAPPACTGSDPLTLKTAFEVLQRTRCVQVLTLRLPKTTTLSLDQMDILCHLRQLRKLEISAKLSVQQLWQLLRACPHLGSVELFHLSDPAPGAATAPAVAPGAVVTATTTVESPAPIQVISALPVQLPTKLHLTSLSLIHAELGDDTFVGLLRATKDTLTSLRLTSTTRLSRGGFKRGLEVVGRGLLRLSLQKVTFRPVPTEDTAAPLAQLLDDLPAICPLLEELQVCSNKLCSSTTFLERTLPSLFLTHLELDFDEPFFTEAKLLEMVHNLPAGRMEVLSLGSSVPIPDSTKLQRACEEIGAVLLRGSSTDV